MNNHYDAILKKSLQIDLKNRLIQSPIKSSRLKNNIKKNSFITLTSQASKRSKNDNDNNNNTNANAETNVNTIAASTFNQLPIRKKLLSDFEISEEDKIFDELNWNINKKVFSLPIVKISKSNARNTSGSDKKGAKSLSLMNKTKLDKMYKFDPAMTQSLFQVKRKKNVLDLFQYQTNLLDSIENSISKSNSKKLRKKFVKIRKLCLSKYDLIYPHLEEIEKKEREVIKKVNITNQHCERMLKTQSLDFSRGSFHLKRIKFIKIFQKK